MELGYPAIHAHDASGDRYGRAIRRRSLSIVDVAQPRAAVEAPSDGDDLVDHQGEDQDDVGHGREPPVVLKRPDDGERRRQAATERAPGFLHQMRSFEEIAGRDRSPKLDDVEVLGARQRRIVGVGSTAGCPC